NNSGCEAGLPSCMSSTGATKPRPKSWPHVRLTIALLKYGLLALVTQSARTGRNGSADLTLGSSAPRNFGGRILADSGSARRLRTTVAPSAMLGVAPPRAAARGLPLGRTFVKKAAIPQY